ncbi:uncharacterized protein LOC106154173 [Lingula anatina]|uniref:Uncharacterized protein LOC106154173 n=1 Tax=Lingula anatina TaxID=7574 RepID=A0A1S3HEH2_LINAN|nr:uncharacterized protein LOC106154173 [Lingula anatina]|eukprot:XP_013383901.1 uncharacterized protein LOC106154173 [Lingula anatina]
MARFLTPKGLFALLLSMLAHLCQGQTPVLLDFTDNTKDRFDEGQPLAGATLELTCKVNFQPRSELMQSFKWLFNGEEIPVSPFDPSKPQQKDRINIAGGEADSTLYYPGVTLENSGLYTCTLDGTFVGEFHKEIYVIEVVTNNVTLNRTGQNATLECTVYNWPAYDYDSSLFKRDGVQLNSNGKDYFQPPYAKPIFKNDYISGSVNELVILNAGPEDAGEYTCGVSLIGPRSHIITKSIFVTSPTKKVANGASFLESSTLSFHLLVLLSVLWSL